MHVPRKASCQFFAVLLAVMAVSPFTAPFSTCDFADLAGHDVPYDGPSLKFKVPSDHSPVAAAGSAAVQTVVAAAILPGHRKPPNDRLRPLQTILRL